MTLIRFYVEGDTEIRWWPIVSFHERFMPDEDERRRCAAVIFNGGVYEFAAGGMRGHVWECPKIEFVSYDRDGEPDVDWIYADDPRAKFKTFKEARHELEPDFVLRVLRPSLLGLKVAAE